VNSNSPVYHMLAPADRALLRRGAKAAARVERASTAAINAAFDALEEQALRALEEGREPPEPDLEDLLLRNAYDAIKAAIETQPRLPAQMASEPPPRTGKGPSIKIPTNPRRLREWWDQVRKGRAPARIQALANRIKAAYIHKVQTLWQEYGEAFRAGQAWSQDETKARVRRAVAVGRNRGRTIVATETTRYYNQARRGFYDGQDSVTHYLYVAVRDSATTKWCKPGVGRDGIVYTKGSAILEKETPPTHYQCRSEILPLSPFNPNHKKFIDDPTRRRENRSPAKLLPGWNT